MKPHGSDPQNDETAQAPASIEGGIERHHHRTFEHAIQQAGRHELGRDSADSGMPDVNYPTLITNQQAAKMLSISVRTLAKLTSTNAIPSITIGRSRRYRVDEVSQWIASGCPEEPGAGDAIRQRMRGGAA